MTKKNHYYIRSILWQRVKSLYKPIRNVFMIATLSILSIELIGKKYNAINHSFYVLGDIYLKLCYSITAAIIFYFINQHLPREKRKLKSLLFLNNKIHNIHFEFKYLLLSVSEKLEEIRFSEISRDEFKIYFEIINPNHVINAKHDGHFKDWYDYINYKSLKIKAATNDLLPLNDIIDSEVMQYIYAIDNIVSGITMNLGKKRFGNTDLTLWSHDLFHLGVELEELIRVFSKKYNELLREHHFTFIQNKMGEKYFPKSKTT